MTEDKLENLLRETRFENNEHKEALWGKLQRKEQEMKDKFSRLQEILADAQLVKELEAIQTAEDAQNWFGGHGVELSISEVKELGQVLSGDDVKDAKKVELDLDDLEDVAGGFGIKSNQSEFISEIGRRLQGGYAFSGSGLVSVEDKGEETMKLAIKW